jgi:hypothetical protein
MPFTLQVQFSGLCLHVLHPERPEIAVLMPDARFNESPEVHLDETDAVPHVGYMRIDLANLALADPEIDAQVPSGDRRAPDDADDGPLFEVVYRFRRQQLDFGLPPVTGASPLSDPGVSIATLGSALRVREDLFTRQPGPDTTSLLFRTVLHGGSFAPSPEVDLDELWMLDRRFDGDAPVVRNFPGAIVWTREVEDRDVLELTISDFDGDRRTRLRLRPVSLDGGERVIRLKIAHLCADNPLEWSGFKLRGVIGEDSDFKWLYRLMEPIPPATWDSLLGPFVLPAPRLMTRPAHLAGAQAGDCAPGSAVQRFEIPA